MVEPSKVKWGFPKIMGTILGVPIIRIIVFWGLYWGSLILGNYQIPLQDAILKRRIESYCMLGLEEFQNHTRMG